MNLFPLMSPSAVTTIAAPLETAAVAKKRAAKYDEKLTINGTFEDVIGLSVKDPVAKKETKK